MMWSKYRGILQARVTEICATNCGDHQAEPLSEIQSSLRKRHDMSRCERRKKYQNLKMRNISECLQRTTWLLLNPENIPSQFKIFEQRVCEGTTTLRFNVLWKKASEWKLKNSWGHMCQAAIKQEIKRNRKKNEHWKQKRRCHVCPLPASNSPLFSPNCLGLVIFRSTISTNEKQKFTLGWLASFYNVIYDCFIMLCDFF